MKIFIANEGFPAAQRKLRGQFPGGDFVVEVADASRPLQDQVQDCDVLIPSMSHISADVIRAADRLKLIVQFGVGLEGVDIQAACEQGVYVTNTPGSNAVSLAEHALFLMLALARRHTLSQDSFQERMIGFPIGETLHGKTLGVLGLGNSGRELAIRARSLGMHVLATRRRPTEEDQEIADFVGTDADLDYVVQESDFVSLHMPLNAETEGMIDRDVLKKMKPSAFLINVARGGLIDRDALIEALENEEIAGVGLDVFWTEPPHPEDEIFSFKSVVRTPHVGGVTEESYDRAAKMIREHVDCLRKTGKPLFHYCK